VHEHDRHAMAAPGAPKMSSCRPPPIQVGGRFALTGWRPPAHGGPWSVALLTTGRVAANTQATEEGRDMNTDNPKTCACGCGAELPPSRGNRPRRWVSEAHRKQAARGTTAEARAAELAAEMSTRLTHDQEPPVPAFRDLTPEQQLAMTAHLQPVQPPASSYTAEEIARWRDEAEELSGWPPGTLAAAS
jgi:hypothetical protein